MKRSTRTAAVLVFAAGSSLLGSSPLFAGVTINGSQMGFYSGANVGGTAGTLSSDGYLGTYIDVTSATPTPVAFTLNADGASAGSTAPEMTLSVANSSQSFSVTSSANNYSDTVTLPQGVYFVRTQLDNSAAANSSAGITAGPSLTLNSLTVSGTGVEANQSISSPNAAGVNYNLNSNSSQAALDAATTYANNFRSGVATVHLQFANGQSVGAGAAGNVSLISNAFHFAVAVPGQSYNFENEDGGSTGWINYNTTTGVYTPPTAGTTAYGYQQALLNPKNGINMLVPTNAGKWANNEASSGSVNMSLADAITAFASANGLGERMHNMIWWEQQPTFVNNDFTSKNYSALSASITSRIGYYVGGTSAALNNGGTPRTDYYNEMDVLNEPVNSQSHTENYLGAYGITGIASIYNQVKQAVAAAGGSTLLYSNEYNVLQNSPKTISSAGVESGSDAYANWYLNYITQVNAAAAAAGDGKVVSGTGSELYVDYANASTPSLSPATMQQGLANLAVAGNPISLTEFGSSSSNGTGATPTQAAFASDLTTALTMMYGDPQATTFGFWGGLGGPVDGNSSTSLYNTSGYTAADLTAVGTAWENFIDQYQTDLNLSTDVNGDLDFSGTYGTYDLTISGQEYQFTITPGDADVTLTVVPEPAALLLLPAAALLRRRWHRN